MVAQTTDDLLRELDRAQGGPVEFVDPRNHARYVMIPQETYQRVQPLLTPAKPINGDSVEWNQEKNSRRWALVDKEIAGTLSVEEAIELESLQQQMLAYRQRVAPLPMDRLRELHAQLLEKAARAEGRR
jgi:hypothetical protein